MLNDGKNVLYPDYSPLVRSYFNQMNYSHLMIVKLHKYLQFLTVTVLLKHFKKHILGRKPQNRGVLWKEK